MGIYSFIGFNNPIVPMPLFSFSKGDFELGR
jgi:hypothetical protein